MHAKTVIAVFCSV